MTKHNGGIVSNQRINPNRPRALDPRRISSLRSLLRTFVDRGHTMIIISHSMGFLGGVSDNILFMEGGVAVEYGPTEEVLNSPKDPRTKDFLKQAE